MAGPKFSNRLRKARQSRLGQKSVGHTTGHLRPIRGVESPVFADHVVCLQFLR